MRQKDTWTPTVPFCTTFRSVPAATFSLFRLPSHNSETFPTDGTSEGSRGWKSQKAGCGLHGGWKSAVYPRFLITSCHFELLRSRALLC
jgi:hypothetical protein